MFSFDISGLLEFGSRLIVLFMCIPVHEFAHAWAAVKLGDETPRYQGRLTLNPFAHFDILGGLMILFAGFGYGKPVQVNPLRFKQYRKGMALTAAAGPISNLIMAYIATVIYKFLLGAYEAKGTDALWWLTLIFMYIAIINVGLAVFNLIPIPPLDGQKIFAYFAPADVNRFMEQNQYYISLGLIVLVVSGALNRPLGFLENIWLTVMDKLTIWVDPIVSAVFK
ncbi:MAG: site-2 protease family protein [Ruminococcus sp.]|nr:site-2 protease family protein [Ruminococcus sp.]